MGYLLDALSNDETLSVENALLIDPHLRVRLKSLRELLFPLASDNDVYEPPDGLSDRVLGVLDNQYPLETVVNDAPPAADLASAGLPSDRNKMDSGPGRGWADLFVGLTAAIVGLCILSPAILKSQEGARASQCSGKLHELGEMIRDYAFFRPGRVVPEVEAEGPLSFAGVYAIRLSDMGFLSDRSKLWCSSSQLANPLSFSFSSNCNPSIRELIDMTSSRREFWQHVAGGSYAYNLGIMVDDEHSTPRMQSRPHFAILADAPLRESAQQKTWTVHMGIATNILYEDGHTQLVRFNEPLDFMDHPYWNDKGENRAGVDSNDSVLGRSNRNPLE